MTETRYNLGDRAHIPKGRPAADALSGAHGVVIEVYPGTGPGTQFKETTDKLEWSTSPQFLVDFGAPIGRMRRDEGLLEPEPN